MTPARTGNPDMDIKAALEAHKPALAAQYVAGVEYTLARMVRQHGADLCEQGGILNSYRFAKIYHAMIVDVTSPRRRGVPCQIIRERLDAEAARYADDTVTAWEGKIAAKLGQLENATVGRLNGSDFIIRGTKGGHRVLIHQNMIVNSRDGRPYNQFPARIYVDDCPVSEAKFRELC